MKMKTLTISYPHLDRNFNGDHPEAKQFRVEKITNSVDYVPHQYLTKGEVNDLCASKDWTVTTQPVK